DLVRGVPFGEPEIAVRTARHAEGTIEEPAVRRRDRELGEGTGRADPPDPVGVALAEPEIAVGAGGDEARMAGWRPDGKFEDRTGRGDAPDPVAVELGDPEVAVRPSGDAGG